MLKLFSLVLCLLGWFPAIADTVTQQQQLRMAPGEERVINLGDLARSVSLSEDSIVDVQKFATKEKLLLKAIKSGEVIMDVELGEASPQQYRIIVAPRLEDIRAKILQIAGLKAQIKNGQILVSGFLENKAAAVEFNQLKLKFGSVIVDDSTAQIPSSNSVVNTINRILSENDIANVQAQAYGRIIVLEGSPKNESQAELAMRIGRIVYPELENRLSKDSNGAPSLNIEVLFVEADKDGSLEFGINTQFGGAASAIGTKGALASAQIDPIKKSEPIGATGLTWQVGGLSTFLKMVQEKASSRVFANPKLVARSGSKARFHSGQTMYVKVEKLVNEKVVSELLPIDSGIVLDILPKLDDIGQIDSTIETEVADFAEPGPNAEPTLLRSHISTAVTIKDGQTIMLSGLTRKQNRKKVTRTPLLADVPIIGEFFKERSFIDSERDMIILVTMSRIKAQDSKTGAAADILWEKAGKDVEFRILD